MDGRFQNCLFLETNFGIINWKLEEFSIWKIRKICYLEISKNFKFGKIQEFPIWKISKIVNSENPKNV